jgi:hypothetical protein
MSDIVSTAQPVLLEYGPAWVRELSGLDEQLVEEGGTPAALALLDRVLVAGPGGTDRPAAAALVPSDRDALLAAVYRRSFGDRIQATATCGDCGEPFDVEFSLGELERALAEDRRAPELVEENGFFSLADGTRFRLPTGFDECEVAALAPGEAESELRRRLVLGGDAATAEDAMAELAPLLERDLELVCPECGAAQTLRFELPGYLLRALAQERRQLAQEVHALALAYGWGLAEILTLPRSRRRAYVELASARAPARRGLA